VEDYCGARKNEKKVHGRKKRQYEYNKVQEIKHLMYQNNTQKFYKLIEFGRIVNID
jgi:hypothetical protein